MRAIGVREDGDRPGVLDVPEPEPDEGEVLIRVLGVGVDGTDHHVIEGGHGEFPEGDDYLVLGHEAVGVVADPNGTRFSEGDVVVPTVRRPPDGTNPYFERGEPDMAPGGEYVERGIVGAHGFMAEYATSPAEFLVEVPRDLAEWGFLVEPISITEKALELAYAARSTFTWEPEVGLVVGNGPLGLLTLAMLGDRSDRTYCVGRRDRPDPTIDVIEKLGATYVDSRETPVAEFPDAHERADFVYEATSYAPHSVESVQALAPNGVAALLGIPGDHRMEVDVGALHRETVLHNKAVVGSVNSNVRHFEAAVETLAELPEWLLDDLVTGVHGIEEFERAFDRGDDVVKTAVAFGSLDAA
jgi:threonine dehydrogenase-like Zn-dependent dehydrogenase